MDLRKIIARAEKLSLEELKELVQRLHQLVTQKEIEEARAKEQERLKIEARTQKVFYQFEYKSCGKPSCKKCKDGVKSHGPYWYSYKVDAEGRQRSSYIGKNLQKVGLGPGVCSECGKPALEGTFLCPNHMAQV